MRGSSSRMEFCILSQADGATVKKAGVLVDELDSGQIRILRHAWPGRRWTSLRARRCALKCSPSSPHPRRLGRWQRKPRNSARTEFDSPDRIRNRSEEHTSELQSRLHLVCRLLLEKKK